MLSNTRVSILVGPSLLMAIIAVHPPGVRGQEDHDHDHGQEAAGHHHEGLHFSHPIFTESVSPDTKLRLDFGRAWEADGSESEIEFEGEYAFHRAFSIEVGMPYSFVQATGEPSISGQGNLEVSLKGANYAFEDQGVLVGYGLSVGIPTGDAADGLGSDHVWELEPFLNAGVAVGRAEFVGWARFGVPTNQNADEEVETDFGYDLSALYHATPRVEGLLELNGASGLSGEGAGSGTLYLSPGIKVAPMAGSPLLVGVGANVPLDDAELDAGLRVSLFWHF